MGGDAVSKIAASINGDSANSKGAVAAGASEAHIRVALMQSGMTMELAENFERWKLRDSSNNSKRHTGALVPVSSSSATAAAAAAASSSLVVSSSNETDAQRLTRLLASMDHPEQQHQQQQQAKLAIENGSRKFVDLPAQNQEDEEELAALLQKLRDHNEQEAFLAAKSSSHHELRPGSTSSSTAAATPRVKVNKSELGDTLPDQRLAQTVVLGRSSSLMERQQSARSRQPKPLFDFPGHPSAEERTKDERRSTLFLAGHGRPHISASHRQHPDMQLARWLTAVHRTAVSSKTKDPF
jgi:hypothetical protein